MRRRPWTLPLVTAIMSLAAGCADESSTLSPTSDAAPDRFAVATREMADVARRNRAAEAAFNRKLKASQAAASDPNTDRPQPSDSTADSREKS